MKHPGSGKIKNIRFKEKRDEYLLSIGLDPKKIGIGVFLSIDPYENDDSGKINYECSLSLCLIVLLKFEWVVIGKEYE